MKEQWADNVSSQQGPHVRVVPRWIFLCFLTIGFFSFGCYLCDLIYPGHFVGDMYGLEVFVRLWLLAVPTALMFAGVVLVAFARIKRLKGLNIAGNVFVILSSLVLLAIALGVGYSRWKDEVRRGYPRKSVEELLRIAREEKDQFAIDALMFKRDRAAVPGLADILLDEGELGRLRVVAAHALGEIGGEEAREALEKVRASQPPDWLKVAVEYALETRMKVPREVEDANTFRQLD